MSGSHIPKKQGDVKDIVDPYVVVKLYTTERSCHPEIIIQTDVVKDNGLNPVWNKECTFEYNEQEISMLVVSVHDNDKTLICWNALSVDRLLHQGIHAIEMRLEDFCIAKGTSILCRVRDDVWYTQFNF